MRDLYPIIEPYQTGFLKVSDLHTLYYEEVGNPSGMPVVFLHGGPGGGIDPIYRRYFNPEKWRVVLFDQRGCGKSTPHAELRENTTWHLVDDIEKVRSHLHIDQWAVFGGSWGSTLALAYSQAHPDHVTALFLRGIFMLRQKELLWFYQEGANNFYPDAWEAYLQPIPPDERHDLIHAYYRRLTSTDLATRQAAARAWSTWEASTSKLLPDIGLQTKFAQDQFADAFARIECHYFVHQGFLDSEDQLLKNVHRIRHIPAVIVQGRYDVVCPMATAWELHKVWPEADFVVVSDAGHSITEPGIRNALINATDRLP